MGGLYITKNVRRHKTNETTRNVFVNQTLTARTVGLVGGLLAGLALALTGSPYSYIIFWRHSLSLSHQTSHHHTLSLSQRFSHRPTLSCFSFFLNFLSKTGPSALLQTSTFIRRRMGEFLFFHHYYIFLSASIIVIFNLVRFPSSLC